MKKIILFLAFLSFIFPISAHAASTTSDPWITTNLTSIFPNMINGVSPNVGINITNANFATLEVQSTTTTSGSRAFTAWNSAGTPLMVIQGDGKVGIGTTTPSAKLEIGDSSTGAILSLVTNSNASGFAETAIRNGYTSATGLRMVTLGTGFTTAGSFFQNGASVVTDTALTGGLSVGTLGTAPLRLYSSGSERMRVDTNGNVGIGTSTPGYLLSLQSSSNSNIQLSQNNGSVGVGATIGYDQLANQRSSLSFGTNSGGTGFVSLGTSNGGAVNERMRIDGSGNVGIGTTSPSQQFVVSNSGAAVSQIITSGTGSGAFIQASVESGGTQVLTQLISQGSAVAGTQFGLNNAGASFLYSNSTTGLGIGTAGNAPVTFAVANTELMRLTTSGNIGIGSSTPWGKLSVNPNGIGSGVPEFVIGSSTKSDFVIDGTGHSIFNGTTPELSGNSMIQNTFYANGIGVAFVNNVNHSNTGGAGILAVSDASTATVNGDRLGFYLFSGVSDGVHSTNNASGMISFATENFDAGGNGANLQFQVTPNRSGTRNTAMTIDQNSRIGMGTTTPTGTLSVQSNSSTAIPFIVATSTGKTVQFTDAIGNQYSAGDPVVASSCGTSPIVATGSNNNRGRITAGSGLVSSCTITFADGGWQSTVNAPVCTVDVEGAGLNLQAAPTKTSLVVTGGTFTSDTFTYNCGGF